MLPIALLLLALLPTSLVAQDDPVVARAGELSWTRSEYADWLVARHGATFIEDFVIEQLMLEEARARDLLPDDETVARAYDDELDRIIRITYRGKVDRYHADLTTRGYTPESWRTRRLVELRAEMAQANLARAARQPSDEQLAARFTQVYGPDGEHVRLEVVFFSAYRDLDPDDPRPDVAALKAEARRRAESARERWSAGASLEELLELGDAPKQGPATDGVIERYSRNLLGVEVEQAVNSLDRAGEIAPPVDVFDGSWLVRLAGREPVTLEEVREQLLEELWADPVDTGEMSAVRTRILEGLTVEIAGR
jgi:hypothetical protein